MKFCRVVNKDNESETLIAAIIPDSELSNFLTHFDTGDHKVKYREATQEDLKEYGSDVTGATIL